VTNNEKDPALFRKNMKVKKVNWIVSEPDLPVGIYVKNRYRKPAVGATINPAESQQSAVYRKYEIIFDKPQQAVSPGQSAVFYTKKGEMLGGGIIL
jgi:tRNA-specific 2-thiouridylase